MNPTAPGIYLLKDSYTYERNTPTLIFENLKPVEISKNHLNIIWTPLKVVKIFKIRRGLSKKLSLPCPF